MFFMASTKLFERRMLLIINKYMMYQEGKIVNMWARDIFPRFFSKEETITLKESSSLRLTSCQLQKDSGLIFPPVQPQLHSWDTSLHGQHILPGFT